MELQFFFFIKGKKFEHNSIESQQKKKKKKWARFEERRGKKKRIWLERTSKKIITPARTELERQNLRLKMMRPLLFMTPNALQVGKKAKEL